MSKIVTPAIQQVKDHWGDAAPEWVVKFAKACDETSQKEMAQKIRRSPALVKQVLKNKYPGRVDHVQSDVEKILNNQMVVCPLLGSLDFQQCLSNQNMPLDCTNAHRVQLFKACRKCPHNSKNQGDKS